MAKRNSVEEEKEREEKRREDDSLRSSDRLESCVLRINHVDTSSSARSVCGGKIKSPLFRGLVSLMDIVSPQSQAYQAKKRLTPVATCSNSHNQNSGSSLIVSTWLVDRSAGNQAYLTEAEGRRSSSAVLRLLSLLPYCIFSCLALGRSLLILGPRLIHTLSVARTQSQIFLNAVKITGILRICLHSARLWITHFETRRITVISCHLSLLVLVAVSVSQACPDIKTDQGSVACRNILPYIKAMTLGQDALAKKLLVSQPQK